MATSAHKPNSLLELIGFAILFAGLFVGYLMLSSIESFSGDIQKDEWYAQYSHYVCEESIKKQIDHASSYMRDGNFKLVSDSGERKSIVWVFLSGDQPGSPRKSTAVCEISKERMRVSATFLNLG